jgi:hypothetical protein
LWIHALQFLDLRSLFPAIECALIEDASIDRVKRFCEEDLLRPAQRWAERSDVTVDGGDMYMSKMPVWGCTTERPFADSTDWTWGHNIS